MPDKTNSNKDNSNDNKDVNQDNYYVGLGIPLGLIFGSALGLIFDNLYIVPAFGVLLGIVIGTMIDYGKDGSFVEQNIKRDLIKIILVTVIGVILILLVPKIISYL